MAQLKKNGKNASTKIFFLLSILTLVTIICPVEEASALSPKIVINMAPPIINADGKTHEIITIELVTSNDQPYIAPEDIPIQLTSSNTDIGSIQTFVTIPEGATYSKAEFTTKKNSGITIITAASPGFETDEAYLQVLRSNFDAYLRVFASPDAMPAKSGGKGIVTVQIIDSSGEPFNAIEDIDVILTSSNHSICTVTRDLVIERGTNYVTTNFVICSRRHGVSLISAQAQGFSPGDDTLTTYNTTNDPTSISLHFGSEAILPDSAEHEFVTVQLMDKIGNPAAADSRTTVYLSSSNSNIVTIEEKVIINSGMYRATAVLTTNNVIGESIISASSPRFLPYSEPISVRGQVLTTLGLSIFPDVLIADGGENHVITVQVLDEQGNPVEASDDISILLASSNENVGSVPELVIIEKGMSYATAPFTSHGLEGEAKIMASTMGIASADSIISTITLSMNVTLSAPVSLLFNQSFIAEVQVTSGGHPVANAEVTWTALGAVIQDSDETTDENGIARAQIVQKYDQLRFKADVSKIGYESEEVAKNIQITQDIEQTDLTVTLLGSDVKVFHLLIGFALLIAVILGGYLYLKRKKSTDQEPEDIEIYG